ncbi:hypothetical protein [Ekhidna sp.]|uniref:hypothetical protein n=1 Tax=Ekhidna sp. TaxID=2608089 RepID=UPI003298A62F
MADGTLWVDAAVTNMEDIIKQLWVASDGRKECRLVLKGEPLPRVVQPFGVCQTTANKVVLVCRQVSGYTKGGGSEGYRNLSLVQIEDVEILKRTFLVPSDFDPLDAKYKEWVYHI